MAKSVIILTLITFTSFFRTTFSFPNSNIRSKFTPVSAYLTECGRNRVIRAMNPFEMLGDEIVRESVNVASNLGKVAMGGVQLVGEGVKVAAPVVGQAVKTGYEVAAPLIKEGFETAAPIVDRYAREGYETAAPIVDQYVKQGVEYATPVAQKAADDALAALTPYLEAGKAIPDDLLRAAKIQVGAERLDTFIDSADTAKTGLAAGLRNFAGFLDGGTETVTQPIAPVVPAPPVNPVKAVLDAQSASLERAIELKRQQAMAPIQKFEDEVVEKATRFAVLTGSGFVGLFVIKKFFEPLEKLAQQALLVLIGSGLLYATVAWGPKAVKIYQILNDDAAALSNVITLAPPFV
mmetsp:Transcript_39292/g.87848  ORF Transcript_39292/g.87848 Transcript_39292/m.87848 type:complete len:350 (-) Transcript_39292:410-1459(-)